MRPTSSPILRKKRSTPRHVRKVKTGFVPSVCSTSMMSRVVPIPSSRTVHKKQRLTSARNLLTNVSSNTTMCTTQLLTRHPRFTSGVVITLLPSAKRHCLSARLFTFSACPLRWVLGCCVGGLVFSFFLYKTAVFPTFSRACRRLDRHTITTARRSDLSLTRGCVRRTLGVRPTGPRGTLLFSGLNAVRHQRRQCRRTLSSCALTLGVTPHTVPTLVGHTTLCLRLKGSSLTQVSCSLILSVRDSGRRTLLVHTCVCVQRHGCGFTGSSCRHLLGLTPRDCGNHLKLTALRRGRNGCRTTLSVLGTVVTRGKKRTAQLAARRCTMLCMTHTNMRRSVGRISLTVVSLRRTVGLSTSRARTCLVQKRVCLSRGGGRLTGHSFRGTVSLNIPRNSLESLLLRYGWCSAMFPCRFRGLFSMFLLFVFASATSVAGFFCNDKTKNTR